MNNTKEKQLLNKYLQDCDTICVYSSNNLDKIVNSIISNLIQYEKPDMYSIVGEELFIVEHFRFDSYDLTKNGSDYRKKAGIINNNFTRMLKGDRKDNITYTDNIESTGSTDNYINNFIVNFNDHYNKIPIYKKKINNFFLGNVKTLFFIEDESPLGNYYIDENRYLRLLYIFQFKKIIGFLLDHKEIFAIFYGYYNGNKKKLMFIENNEDSLNKFISDYGFADNLECYWINPNVICFSNLIVSIKE